VALAERFTYEQAYTASRSCKRLSALLSVSRALQEQRQAVPSHQLLHPVELSKSSGFGAVAWNPFHEAVQNLAIAYNLCAGAQLQTRIVVECMPDAPNSRVMELDRVLTAEYGEHWRKHYHMQGLPPFVCEWIRYVMIRGSGSSRSVLNGDCPHAHIDKNSKYSRLTSPLRRGSDLAHDGLLWGIFMRIATLELIAKRGNDDQMRVREARVADERGRALSRRNDVGLIVSVEPGSVGVVFPRFGLTAVVQSALVRDGGLRTHPTPCTNKNIPVAPGDVLVACYVIQGGTITGIHGARPPWRAFLTGRCRGDTWEDYVWC